MDIYLHNTVTGKKEVFIPLIKPLFGFIGRKKVRMYHCGPTVYWNQHIGNMRAMVMADLVRRMFVMNGYDVNFVRNYTDVGHLTGDNIGDADTGEDRMTKAVNREHLSPDAIAHKYIQSFERDTAFLNVLVPTHTPRATEHIPEMIDMVQSLVQKGFAYVAPEAVYFDVTKFPRYTELSGQDVDALEQGEGHGAFAGSETPSGKRNPRDFSLWFFKVGAHANALQTWPSPWGEGFPGWHIECSAMSKYYLGPTLDIHMGGIEHISIHHTNEIAQSECANGVHYVNYWLHNEHLLVNGKKMAKSEGTSYVLQDIIDRGISPLALRYFFLQAHYRSQQNFTWESLAASATALKRLQSAVSALPARGKINKTYAAAFKKVVSDDVNVTAGLAVVWDLLKDKTVADADKKATILWFDSVLGLELELFKPVEEIPEKIAKLVQERESARANKDWKKSDDLRDQIDALGFEVKDTPNGQNVRKK